MSEGDPDVKAIITAALGHPAGPGREAYLDAACGDNVPLRRCVDELLATTIRASEISEPACDPEATIADEGLTGNGNAAEAFEPTESDQSAHHTPSPGDPDATASLGGRGPAGDGDVGGLGLGIAVRCFGDYEIRRELGRGGMGVVYEARQVSLNRLVALKVVKAGLLAGEDELRRFQNEAEAVALLDHPGIAPVYEVGEHDGQRYFSMKLVSGGSLAALMDRYKGDAKAAARLVAEAAEAVAHAHARGILHRDLKPANILLDDQGHVHVSDFGLAKRVEADIELTQTGAILGTPAYMAPEQASGRRGSITTATDVYGLGAVLYALLTGRAPFGKESVVETLDAVRNTAPEEPTKLDARIPRDLETICLKCLEKDPGRRYATAQALAGDLRAWLEGRPIEARRVGAARRAWLWCKRRPAVAALSAAVALAIVGATATVIAIQAKANADLRAANRRVEERYELAVDAIKTFHTGVSEDFLLEQDQFKDLRDRLLKSAADFYRKLSASLGKDTDFASRRAVAASNFELAELTAKVGRNEDALAAHRAVLAAREALAAEPAADAAAKVDVGRSLVKVAGMLEATVRTDESLAAYRKSEAMLAGLAQTDPGACAALAECRSRMGHLLSSTGKTAEALEAFRLARAGQEALATAPGASIDARREFADTLIRIGILLYETGKLGEAETEYRAGIAIQRTLAGDNLADTQLRSRLAQSRTDLGILLSDTGRPGEAEGEYRKALAMQKTLAADNPSVTVFRSRLADIHTCLGSLLSQTDRPDEAEAEYRQALAISQKLTDDNPAVTEFRCQLALCHRNLGVLLFYQLGRPRAAEAEYRASRAIHQKLADDNPAVTEFRRRLANIHVNLGNVLAHTGKPAEAEAEYRKALAICQELADDHPAVPEFREHLALGRFNLGILLAQVGRPAAAEFEGRQALDLYQKLAEEHPKVPSYRDGMAGAGNNLSVVLRGLGRPAEARAVSERAVDIEEALVKEHPEVPRYRCVLAESHHNLGLARLALADPAGAAADLRRATALVDALPPRSSENWLLSGFTHAAVAGLGDRPGSGVSAAEAASEVDTAIASLRRAVDMGYHSPDAFRTEDALDPLRDRPEFRLLVLDAAFPAEPFAGAD